MKPEQIYILSIMESAAFLILWSGLDNKLYGKYLQKALFLFILPLISVFTHHLSNPLGTMINLFFIPVFIFLFFRVSLLDLAFESLIVILMTILLQMIALIPLKLLLGNIEYCFTNGIYGNTLFILLSILARRYFPFQKIMDIYHQKLRWAGISIINTFIFLFTVLCIWTVNKDWVVNNLFLINIFALIMISINITAILYGLKTKKQQRIIETYRQHNPIIKNLIDEVRRRQHDFKNHLQVIYALTQTNEPENIAPAIQKYINRIVSSVHQIDSLIHIENKILASLLYIKATEAKSKDICFEYHIDSDLGAFPMDDFEIVEILGNLIDNAFETPLDSDQLTKEVVLSIIQKKDHLIFEVKNNGIPIKKELEKKIFTKGFSTKATENRGFGLYNVKLLVEKYRGEIEIECKDGYTRFTLIF